ncbi:MAG: hypothetical protein ACC652_00135 [Acidimicrobiales bacterium]
MHQSEPKEKDALTRIACEYIREVFPGEVLCVDDYKSVPVLATGLGR